MVVVTEWPVPILGIVLLVWLATICLGYNKHAKVLYIMLIMGPTFVRGRFSCRITAIFDRAEMYMYSETCLCHHLRNRDNLGIKGSYSSP